MRIFKIQISLFFLLFLLSGEYHFVYGEDEDDEGPGVGVTQRYGGYHLPADEYAGQEARKVDRGDIQHKAKEEFKHWMAQLPPADEEEFLKEVEHLKQSYEDKINSATNHLEKTKLKEELQRKINEAIDAQEVKRLKHSYEDKINNARSDSEKSKLKEELRLKINELIDAQLRRRLQDIPPTKWAKQLTGFGLKTLREHLYHVTQKDDRKKGTRAFRKDAKTIAAEAKLAEQKAFLDEFYTKADDIRKRRSAGTFEYPSQQKLARMRQRKAEEEHAPHNLRKVDEIKKHHLTEDWQKHPPFQSAVAA